MEGVLGVEDGMAVRVGGFARLEELEAGLLVVGGGGRTRDVVFGVCSLDLEMRRGRRRRRGRGTFEDGAEELAASGRWFRFFGVGVGVGVDLARNEGVLHDQVADFGGEGGEGEDLLLGR